METYLVGGAVRDRLLGIPVKDRDWVVVGTTPEAMVREGYTAVGKDFPVFLHPQTHEEYALARTERKTGPGYHGFQFNTDESVTIEDDLLRRDLTINAIAESTDGKLIDPYNGQQDIDNKVLRHVSPAFAEDPVRVLRLAKFMARFAHFGFTVAEPTTQLVRSMVNSGEVDHLVAERVWQEFNAALTANTPRAFFTTLDQTGATDRIMPELSQLLANTQALDSLDQACQESTDAGTRFAALCAEFSADQAPTLEKFSKRLRIPAAIADLALLTARFAGQSHQAMSLDAAQLHALLKSVDATRRPERFQAFLHAVKAHSKAVVTKNNEYPQADRLLQCAAAMRSIDAAQIAKSQPNKTTISTAIREAEVSAIDAVCRAG